MKYSEFRQKISIKNGLIDVDMLAHLTHYLHNHSNGIAHIYKTTAEETFHEISNRFKITKEKTIKAILPIEWDIPFPSPREHDFTFIDLFAGIGGFRIPLQRLNGKCVFSSEINNNAKMAYELNFGEIPFGDITKIDIGLVPKHDILCAGFPCQPFSISGKMKGFEDTRGTLVYQIFKIIEEREPKVVFLENVKHLRYHDQGRTLKTIIQHLEELGYIVSTKVLNASDYGVPQNRERIIIIGHKKKKFNFTEIKKHTPVILNDFLEEDGGFEYLDEPFTLIENPKRQDSGLIFAGYRNKTIRKAGVRAGTEHLSRVHKQPNRIYSTDGIHPALPSQESSGRFWILYNGVVRKLTIKECYKIMGFPDNFIFIENKGELYKQIGNSVAIPTLFKSYLFERL